MLLNSIEDIIKLTATDDWDFEHGKIIPEHEWKTLSGVARLINELTENKCPAFFSPCGDGSAHVGWSLSSKCLVSIEQHQGIYACTWRKSEITNVIENLDVCAAVLICRDFINEY